MPVEPWRGGITIVEMATPLLKNQGVWNVVPAFRRKFPEALLLADMKTMDGGGFEARAVFAGGGTYRPRSPRSQSLLKVTLGKLVTRARLQILLEVHCQSLASKLDAHIN